MFREITQCRICGSPHLVPVIHLGNQFLTGTFPKDRHEPLTCGPLELVRCSAGEANGKNSHCGLVQLRHSYASDELYGDNYGYRSSLNRSMVEHLRATAQTLKQLVELRPDDLILDIGSNDGTSLSFYDGETYQVAGIDPSAEKFRQFYPPRAHLIADFFSARLVQSRFSKQARLITSIAMFYDLEDPMAFMREIHEVLDDEGVWHLEQSYLPAMLSSGSYDTICHEHLEYYALRQIQWMAQRTGFKIIRVEFNEVNGGSFAVTLAKSPSSHREASARIAEIVAAEEAAGLSSAPPYEKFKAEAYAHREELKRLLAEIAARGESVLGYGASTKGNVILQFCGLTSADIACIAEVNEDKFGAFTPGTGIPIVSEAQAREMKPDYFLVLPWHFRDTIIAREAAYLQAGGKLIFPLPQLETLGRGSIEK